MKGQAFKLSKTNYWIYGVSVVLILFPELFFKKLDAQGLGYIFGTLVFYFLFPLIFGYIAYLVMGKNPKSGATTFSVSLIILVAIRFLGYVAGLATTQV